MRILHAIDLLQSVGGAQSYVRRLSEIQAEAGHEVSIVHGDAETAELAGVVTWRAVDSAAVRDSVESFSPDVIHVHDLGLPVDVEDVAMRRYALVRSLHTFSFACASGTRYFRDGALCTRAHGPGCLGAAVARGCAHRLDLRAVAREYRRISSLLPRLRATPLTILHSDYVRSVTLLNGFSSTRSAAVPYFVEPPTQPAPDGSARVVSFVGRIVRNKGLDVLLQALARVPDAWDALVVAGDGWDVPRCQGLSEKLGIADRVDFRGWVDPLRARATIAGSQVLALPSRWPEPFGIAGLEAMALGRPVVATRGGGVPEWLDDGETGVLVAPGDADDLARALSWVLADVHARRRLGGEARRRAERFSPQMHLEQLHRVYAAAAEPAVTEPSMAVGSR